MRKAFIAMALGAVGALALAGPASAHDCYNTSRSAQGNQSIAAHTSGFATFNDVAYYFLTQEPTGPGLCDAGAKYLIQLVDANAASLGISADTVVSMRATQAGGVGHAKDVPAIQVLSNGKGIDHLEENTALDAFLGAHIGEAFAQCP